MVSGTDEHGTPVMVAADREGLSPRETADRYSKLIRENLRDLGLSYDLFTRTTTANHYRVVQDLFRTLYENGYIVEKTTMGAFSTTTGHTLPDRYIEGTCPICGFDSARGDQCDNCGNQLDPIDLINPRSKIDGTAPVFRETNHLFLDLPAFAEQLTEWVEETGPLADERPQLHARAAQGSEAAADHARPRLGRADSRAPGVRGAGLTSGSTSGSTPSSATCRLRSSGRRTRARPMPGGTGGRTPRRATSTSWARTTSSSTRSSGRASCSGTAREARSERASPLDAAVRHRRKRIPDDGGQAVQRQQGRLDRRRGLPQPLRA